jgi:methionine synthase I (cobalamin-dependent)
MTNRLTSLLAERPWLLADGATGSNLFERGLRSGDAPELWNADHPERVAELQRAFVEAGADYLAEAVARSIATGRPVLGHVGALLIG